MSQIGAKACTYFLKCFLLIWQTPVEQGVQEVRFLFFDQVLQPHFGFEESVLFPLAERKMHRSAELVESLVREHDEVRSRLGTLRSDPKHDLDLRLPALGRLLAAHVRREERDLFEGLQRELDEAALDAIGVQLRARPASGPSCQPRHP